MTIPTDQQWHWGEGNKYAIEGIKTLLLLNGGAALALLAFLGNTGKDTAQVNEIAEAAGNALLFFGFGALVSGLVFVSAYLAQLNYGNRNHTSASVWHIATYALITLGVVLFFGGVMFARGAVIANLK